MKNEDALKRYTVTVVWTMMGSYDIDAFDEDEARNLAKMLPNPSNGEYLEDSFSIDTVEELSNDAT